MFHAKPAPFRTMQKTINPMTQLRGTLYNLPCPLTVTSIPPIPPEAHTYQLFLAQTYQNCASVPDLLKGPRKLM
jgi:hypothetical protein